MHEKKHFLSYRKGRHDAENHVHICALRHLGSHCKMASSHRVTDLEQIPVRISKDEVPTPLSVGPLFISSLLLHLSRTLLGAWRFSIFGSVYSSFHNRLDLREPAFYWVFSFLFPVYPCLSVSLYVKMIKFCSFQFNRLAVSWPPWVWVWSWASYRFLPFTVFFLLACPFVSPVISFIYDVRMRGVVSMLTRPLILSSCGVVCERLLPCRVVTAKWVVSCTRITCIQPLSRCSLTILASSFFSENVVFSLFSFFFTIRSFYFILFFIFGLLANSYPLVSLPD